MLRLQLPLNVKRVSGCTAHTNAIAGTNADKTAKGRAANQRLSNTDHMRVSGCRGLVTASKIAASLTMRPPEAKKRPVFARSVSQSSSPSYSLFPFQVNVDLYEKLPVACRSWQDEESTEVITTDESSRDVERGAASHSGLKAHPSEDGEAANRDPAEKSGGEVMQGQLCLMGVAVLWGSYAPALRYASSHCHQPILL